MQFRMFVVAGALCAGAPAIALAQSETPPASPSEIDQQLLEELRRLRERLENLESQSREDKARIEALERRLRERAEQPALAPAQSPAQPPAATPAPVSQPTRAPPTPSQPPAARDSDSSFGLGQGNALNPEITLYFDMGANISSSDSPEADRFNLREMELDFRAAVAPFADAVATFAIAEEIEEDENGDASSEFKFEVEEAYINFHTLPYDTALKGGKFRNAFGRNNLLHTHDLPQVTRPLAVDSFLGGEGLSTVGASLSWLVPNPGNEYIELIAEVVNADGGEESPILGGADADDPAVLAHAKWFTDLGDWASLEIGGSYLYGASGADSDFDAGLWGIDVTYQRRNPETPDLRSFLVQGELFFGDNDRLDDNDNPFRNSSSGGYIFAQQQLAKNWYAGLRYDYTEYPNSEDFGPGDESWAVSPYVSYYLTEWIRLRAEYQHQADNIDGDWHSDDTLWFSLTFLIGAHPAHPYWVNR
ncbi:MAG: hypothetical protein ACF8QF_01775 [Phycisphaerales bacterium]